MAPLEAGVLVNEWVQRGFEATREIDGERHCSDCYIISFPFGPTLSRNQDFHGWEPELLEAANAEDGC